MTVINDVLYLYDYMVFFIYEVQLYTNNCF